MTDRSFREYSPHTPQIETVERLWKGSIDMHIHPIPDPGMRRRVDSMQAAIDAQAAGMKAIVLKSHYYPTVQLADAAQYVAPDVITIGGLVIGYETGGLSVDVVECQAKLGMKILWMLNSAIQCHKALKKEGGIPILDSKGKLLPDVVKILKIVKKYNICLTNCHLSYEETVPLFEEAISMGITKLLVNHPMFDQIWDPMTMDEMKKLASMGAYIEHCYRCTMPLAGSFDPRDFVKAIREIGAEHTIMSTDFGQVTDAPPVYGMRGFIATMLQLGVSEEEVEIMVKNNPAKLLDLD